MQKWQMLQRKVIKTSLWVILTFLSICPSAFSAPSSEVTPAEQYIRDTFQAFEWNQSFWPILGIFPKPGERLTPPHRLDWNDVAANPKRLLGEFTLGLCSLRFPVLNQTYHFRPLAQQITEDLASWQQSPSGIPFSFAVASALSNLHPKDAEHLVPVMASVVITFLKEHVHPLTSNDLPVDEILGSDFSHIHALGADLSQKNAWVDMNDNLWLTLPAQPEVLIFRIFHELCHVWSRAHTQEMNWVSLTLEEEFRAQVFTERLKRNWNTAFPQFRVSYFEGDLASHWKQFRSTLRLHSEEQRAAVRKFLKKFDNLKQSDQIKTLEGWTASQIDS